MDQVCTDRMLPEIVLVHRIEQLLYLHACDWVATWNLARRRLLCVPSVCGILLPARTRDRSVGVLHVPGTSYARAQQYYCSTVCCCTTSPVVVAAVVVVVVLPLTHRNNTMQSAWSLDRLQYLWRGMIPREKRQHDTAVLLLL